MTVWLAVWLAAWLAIWLAIFMTTPPLGRSGGDGLGLGLGDGAARSRLVGVGSGHVIRIVADIAGGLAQLAGQAAVAAAAFLDAAVTGALGRVATAEVNVVCGAQMAQEDVVPAKGLSALVTGNGEATVCGQMGEPVAIQMAGAREVTSAIVTVHAV